MSQTPDSQAPRSTPIPTELPLTPQPLPGSSANKGPEDRPLLKPFLTFKYSEILYEKKVKQRFGSNQEIIETKNISNQTSEEFLSNAYSQTSNRSKTSAKTAELINKSSIITKRSNYSQTIITQQPVLSNAASFGSYVNPIDPKTADYDAKKAQYYQQYPQGQYQQGYAPNQQQFPPPQYQGGFQQQQYAPQYNPGYQQGYQQGYPPPQRQGLGGNLKNIACIGSCVACLMLLCTSCCQAVGSSVGQRSEEYDDDNDD